MDYSTTGDREGNDLPLSDSTPESNVMLIRQLNLILFLNLFLIPTKVDFIAFVRLY